MSRYSVEFFRKTAPIRVARGARYLDGIISKWAKQLDERKIWMANACDCVLGHLFRQAAQARTDEARIEGRYLNLTGYEVGVRMLSGGSSDEKVGRVWAARHGFLLPTGMGEESVDAKQEVWGVLEVAWRREIDRRLGR